MSAAGTALAPREAVAARQEERALGEAMAPAEPLAPPASRLTLRDLVVTIFLRWKLLLLALLLPVALGFAVAPLLSARFTAESTIVVLTSRDWAGAADISGYGPTVVSVEMLKVVRSEMEIMQSEEVARRLVTRVGPVRLFPGLAAEQGTRGPEEINALATEAARRVLRVESDTNSNIVRARFTHRDREVALAALNALMEAYYERRAEVFNDQNARVLVVELTRYTDRLRELETQIQAVKGRYNLLDIQQEINLTSGRIDALIRREEAVQEQRATAQAQLASARSQLASQPARVLASQDSTNLVPNDDSRNNLSRLMLERQRLAAQYAPGYPGLRELDERIAAARTAVQQAQRSTFSTTREVRNPAVELLSGRAVTLEVESSALQKQAEELARQRAAAEARGGELREAESQLRDLTRQRDGLEAITRQFTTREAGARAEEEARRDRAPNVQTLEAPHAPLEGRTLAPFAMAGGIAAGAAAFLAGALLLTLLRRSYATVDEAERGLSIPALAGLGDLGPAARDLKEVPEIADLAALLLDTRIDGPGRGQGGGRRPAIIQFLYGGPGDGRDLLVRSLGVEMARRRGQDTLIIDLQTDGRAHLAALGSRPLEVERIPGHVLTFNTVIPNLWVSFEARDSNLTDPHVARRQTAELITQLRGAFDVVLVIAPDRDETYPMRRLTGLVDLNLLVVRAERTAGDQARAMRDWVLSSGGNLLGFVLTRHRRVLPRRLAEHL